MINHHGQLEVRIYRKPTFTDSVISNHFRHPVKHKTAGINYVINCLIFPEGQSKEIPNQKRNTKMIHQM
jgi:hypothetical protein